MADDLGLERFVTAQASAYGEALRELRAGQKRGHWIWFVFPQLRGLGQSATAQHYGIASMAEARGYLAHPLLGPRLLQCASALLAVPSRSAEQILGPIDAVKVRSCMTLFEAADPEQPVFREVLARFFEDRADPLTLGMLGIG